MHPYMIASLAIGLAAAASLAAAPVRLRRSAWVAALLSAPFTLVSLDYGAYWHPSRLWGLQLGLEDLVLCVSSGVLLWSLPAGLEAGRVHLLMNWAIMLRRYFAAMLAGAVLVGVCRLWGASPSVSLFTAMAAVSFGILMLQAGYWRLALAGSLSYLTLYTALLKCSWLAFPSFSSEWNWAGLCGVTVIGIPLEEIAWAAGYGAVWPLIMAYTLQARIECVQTRGEMAEESYASAVRLGAGECWPSKRMSSADAMTTGQTAPKTAAQAISPRGMPSTRVPHGLPAFQ